MDDEPALTRISNRLHRGTPQEADKDKMTKTRQQDCMRMGAPDRQPDSRPSKQASNPSQQTAGERFRLTPASIREQLRHLKMRPLPQHGQNFLADPSICDRIVHLLGEVRDKKVLEIGPGLGALTFPLLSRGAHLTALEIDRGLVTWLRLQAAHQPYFRVVEGDALKTLLQQPPPEVIISNLPYQISTAILLQICLLEPLPSQAVFMVQKEFLQRLLARADEHAYGPLSIVMQTFFQIQCCFEVGPEVFEPQPHVDSVIIRLTPRGPKLFSSSQTRSWIQMLRRAFSGRRKKLRNTLGIADDRRPATLTPDEWKQLYANTTR